MRSDVPVPASGGVPDQLAVAPKGGRGEAGVDRPVRRGRNPAPCPERSGVKGRAPVGKPLGAGKGQAGKSSGPAAPASKGGRPGLGKPWEQMDPPISRETYFRRKRAGTLEEGK